MTDIASNLDKVIEKLDGMTSEVVTKNYGMDIASKVDHIAKQLDYVQAGGGGGGDTGITLQINGFQPDPYTPATYTTVPSFDELSPAQIREKGFSNVVVNGERVPIFSVRCDSNYNNDNEPTLETIRVSCGEFGVTADAYGSLSAAITTTLYTISHNEITFANGPTIQST